MAVAVALWSQVAKPGDATEVQPLSDLRVTNIALGDDIADPEGRTTVKLVYKVPTVESGDEDEDEDEDDEEQEKGSIELRSTVLCSLTPGKIEQATIDVVLEGEEEYLIEVVGKNTVHLTGNYIDQTPDQVPYNDESEYDSEEEDFDLREVSSDVEIDPEEMDIPSDDEGRFEEIHDEPEQPKADSSKKRPRDSDAMSTDAGEVKLSKADKKKLKKQKVEGGKAVTTSEEAALVEKKEEKKEGKKEQGKKEEKKGAKKDEKEEKKEEKKGDAEKTLAGGVKIKDHKIGTGPKAKAGDSVSMRYVGKLTNGKIFDQNTKGDPFRFRLGKGEVIKGWDVGIVGMQVGGERLITIPPKMGYGSQKIDKIPANSTLVFEVKLVKIN
ncbi:hypothetical protein WOLCODRAFT_104216 [Wolfiporia cocos MD-104 SS10]|uniref:FK506-binding protein n=1 Tax=Wolfiporia cocos (strain MD-104) TaxID=742152 RepID=A0A2H3K122_WOLCO|nr:hypothetical protein WOLCODRAFT_104216 [Wolfiporia cocos MD-104 SS10]